jgi:hypothetical protein
MRTKPRKPARRYRADAEILRKLETELQAVVDAALVKIQTLLGIEEARV